MCRRGRPPRAARLSRGSGQRLLATIRSSIRSRSTSQYLSDDRSSLSISSVWADSSSSIGSGHNASERLFDFCSVRPDFDFRERMRLPFPAPINDSPLVSPFLFTASHHNVAAVVAKWFGGSLGWVDASRSNTAHRTRAVLLRS